jgi:hypothetical protein
MMTAYAITGTLNPDCTAATTGNAIGTLNGQPYWSWSSGGATWYLWYEGTRWYISQDFNGDGALTVTDLTAGPSWRSSSLAGVYLPYRNATGLPTVASVPAGGIKILALQIFVGIDAGKYVLLKESD